MLEILKKLLGKQRREPVPEPRSVLRRTGAIPATKRPGAGPAAAPARSAPSPARPVAGRAANGARIDSTGPGKNVLIRNKYRREDSGTHETLRIVDDSAIDTGEEIGIDPYNTGSFDRSRNWDKRFRD